MDPCTHIDLICTYLDMQIIGKPFTTFIKKILVQQLFI